MINLKGKKIAVVGLGGAGIAMLQALNEAGASAKGFGIYTETQARKMEVLPRAVFEKIIFGEIEDSALSLFDMVVVTPVGEAYRSALEFAKNKGVSLISDLDLAAQFMGAPIVAVTGSNGKSTTVKLLQEMFVKQGYKVAIYGSEFSKWAEAITNKAKINYNILHLSSRNLELSASFHPHIAILLNLFPTHANLHAQGLMGYFEAKAKVFERQTEQDYLIHEATAENIRELIRKKRPRSKRVMFALDSPVEAPGIYKERRDLIWKGLLGEEENFSLEHASLFTPIYHLNLMPAVAAARICGVEAHHIQAVIDQFKGLPHRMQLIRRMGDVDFIDDSQASNLGASVWGLSCFSSPVIWIAGGAVLPGNRLEDLPRYVKAQIKCIILIGSDKEKLAQMWGSVAPIVLATDLKEAVKLANQKAEVRDAVLFSPACPPDLYKQEPGNARGEEFVSLVKNLSDTPRLIKSQPQFTRM